MWCVSSRSDSSISSSWVCVSGLTGAASAESDHCESTLRRAGAAGGGGGGGDGTSPPGARARFVANRVCRREVALLGRSWRVEADAVPTPEPGLVAPGADRLKTGDRRS